MWSRPTSHPAVVILMAPGRLSGGGVLGVSRGLGAGAMAHEHRPRFSREKGPALSHDQNIDHDDHVRGNCLGPAVPGGQTPLRLHHRWHYWYALSGTIIAVGFVALGVRGLNFSIGLQGRHGLGGPATASVRP